MEAEAAFVRTYCTVHFDPVSFIDLNLPVVIDPWNPEHDRTFRFCDSLQDLSVLEFGILLDKGHEGFHHFFNGLMKLGFTGIFGNDFCHEVVNFYIK